MDTRQYWTYILVSGSGNAMYIGVTNDLERRMWEHRNGQGSEFAKNIGRLGWSIPRNTTIRTTLSHAKSS